MSSHKTDDSTTLFQSKEQTEQMKHVKDQYENRKAMKELKTFLDEEKEPADFPFRPVVKEKKNPHLPYFLDNIIEGAKVLKEERNIKRAPVVIRQQPQVQKSQPEILTPTEIAPSSPGSQSTVTQSKPRETWYKGHDIQPLSQRHKDAMTEFQYNQDYYAKHGRYPSDVQQQQYRYQDQSRYHDSNNHEQYQRHPNIVDQARHVKNEIKEALPSPSHLKRRGEEMIDDAQDAVENIADDVKSALPSRRSVERTVSDAADNVKHYVEDSADKVAKYIPRNVKQNVQGVVDDARELVEDGMETVRDAVQHAPTPRKMKEQAQEFVEDVGNTVSKHVPSGKDVKRTVSNLIEDAEGYIDDVVDDVHQVMPNTVRAIEKKVGQSIDRVGKQAHKAAESIENVIPSRKQVEKTVDNIASAGEDVIDKVKELNPLHKKTVGESIKEFAHDTLESVKEMSPMRKKTITEKAVDYIEDTAQTIKKANPFHEKTLTEKAQDVVEDAVDNIQKINPFHEKSAAEKVSDYASDTVDAMKRSNPFREKSVIEKAQDYAEDTIDSVKKMTPFHKPTTTEKVKEFVQENIPTASGTLAAAATAAKLLTDDHKRGSVQSISQKVVEGAKSMIPKEIEESVTTTVDDIRHDMNRAKHDVKQIAEVVKTKLGDSVESDNVTSLLTALTDGNSDLPNPRDVLINSVEGVTKFCMKNNINFSEVLKENLFPRRAGPIEYLGNMKEEFKLYRTKKQLEKQWGQTRRDVTDAIHTLLTVAAKNTDIPPQSHRELQLLLEAQDALKQDVCALLEVNPKQELTLQQFVKGAQKIIRSADIDMKDLQPIALVAGTKLLTSDYGKAMEAVSKGASEIVSKIGDGHKIEQLANVLADVGAVYNRTLQLLSAVSKESPQIVKKISSEAKEAIEQGGEVVQRAAASSEPQSRSDAEQPRGQRRALGSVIEGQEMSTPSSSTQRNHDPQHQQSSTKQYKTTDDEHFAKQQQPSADKPGLNEKEQREYDEKAAEQRKEIADTQRNKSHGRQQMLASLNEAVQLQIYPPTMAGTVGIINSIVKNYGLTKMVSDHHINTVRDDKLTPSVNASDKPQGFLSYCEDLTDTDEEQDYDGYLDSETDDEDYNYNSFECEDSDY